MKRYPMYPRPNLPSRPLAPVWQDEDPNFSGMAPSMIRDQTFLARPQHVRIDQPFDFSKQGVKPNFEGVHAYESVSKTSAYIGNDAHRWVVIPRGDHFVPAYYSDTSAPLRDQRNKLH